MCTVQMYVHTYIHIDTLSRLSSAGRPILELLVGGWEGRGDFFFFFFSFSGTIPAICLLGSGTFLG